ncbi:hypothetical protein [Bacillus massilinigeriensis]|uniref:hypothetical protein n=1 Tax=Bacillus mediterraneensis TaxID=1805474 RepID=UPI0008F8122E|nr:hypothetical protein [Bacillus mediterraneensis]
MTQGGVKSFDSLVESLVLMGVEPSIVGIKPNHAFCLNKSPIRLNISYKSSLEKVLKHIKR